MTIQQGLCDIRSSGKLGEILQKWLGSDIPITFEAEEMTLNAAIIGPSPGYISQNENGEWEGFHLDFVEEIVKQAAKDGVTLTVNIDYDNMFPTTDYNAPVQALDVPCDVDNCETPPYDIAIGDFVS